MYNSKFSDDDNAQYAGTAKYSSSKYHNIHSDSKKDDKDYHEENPNPFAENPAREELKEEENEDLGFKAAKQLFNETRQGDGKLQKKKIASSIESAIKKAIEEEKNFLATGN